MNNPKLRFKREDGTDYPEWEETQLIDIATRIIVGLATTVTPYYRETGVPMFRNLNIKSGLLDDSDMLYLDETYASKQKTKIIHSGDIITVHTGNIGWSCVVPEKYEGALSFTTLITTIKKETVNNYYVSYYLNSDMGMKQMQDLAFSGGRANLNTNEFQKVVVPYPKDIEEQQKIADFLSTVDEVIAQSEAEVQNLEQQKKAAMQKIFSQEVRFKREDGTDYPEWEEKKIADICEPHARIGWQNLRTDEFLDEGDYYLVTGTDFLNGRVNFATCHYIDRERFEQDKNIQITNGDILITKDGTLGKIALVENMDKEGTLNAGVFVLQNLTPNIYNLYLYQYLTAPYLLDFAFDKATGGTIKHLNQGVLVQFPVPIPCLEEQQKIADFLSAYDEAISYAKQELEKWKELKKGLLQQMFV